MASGEENEKRSHRRRDEDNDNREKDSRSSRRKHSDRDERRRSRGRRDRKDRRRSRTPESSHRRSKSRDRRDRDRDRDRDPDREHRRHRSRDRDSHRRKRREEDAENDKDNDKRVAKRSPMRRGGPLPTQEDSFAITNGEELEKPKEKPNWGTTGVLAAASNAVTQADGSSVTLKYHEPAEARKPSPRDDWKLFVFKDGDNVDTIDLGLRSCWLVGRGLSIVDLPAQHPSISKQHAVIQFRYIEKRNEFGDKIGKVKPYIIDLESANGTILNDEKIPDSRYLELRHKDMLQFGQSSREYVVMLASKS